MIRIIVRARNEIAGVTSKAASDVDKLTKSSERAEAAEKKRAQATKTTTERVDDATKRFKAYTDEVERGTKSGDQAVKQLQAFSREFDRLGNRLPAGSQAADQLYQMGQAARGMAADIKAANAEAAASEKQRTSETKKASSDSIAARRRQADEFLTDVRRELDADAKRSKTFDDSLKREEAGYRRRILAIQQGRETFEAAKKAEADSTSEMNKVFDRMSQDFVAQQQKIRAEIAKTVRAQQTARTEAERVFARGKVSSLAQDLRDLGTPESDVRKTLSRSVTDQSGDVALTRRQQRIQELIREQDKLRNMTPSTPSFLQKLLGVDDQRLEKINGLLHDFENQSNKSSFSAVKLAGNLRGMLILGVVAFFQQIVGAAVALGGTLVSVASSAIQAGAALGGALVAGISQAIPVIGLFAAAWGRVGAVFNAVKQYQKAQQNAAFDSATNADRQRSAADAVRSAQEALSNAQRQGVQAQESLNKARADGVRQIQDLLNAERSAQLQAEEAQRTFNRSLASGNVDQLAQQALDVTTTGLGASRASADANKAVAGGVEGLDSVKQARQAAADAARSATDARRQLAEAQIQATQVVKQMSSTDRLLAGMLSQLSPAERGLYAILTKLTDRYKKVFTGPGGILEGITNSFTYVGARLYQLLGDKRLVGVAKSLSNSIGDQIRGITDFLTSDSSQNFLVLMAREAKRNLPIITSLLENVLTIFMNIAKAASPALHTFLTFLDDLVGKAATATSSSSGLTKLQHFFSQGEKFAEGWITLGLALTRLVLAIVGTSAKQGQDALSSLTGAVNKATAWIDSHRPQVREFFSQALQATKYIFTAVWDLTKALFAMFQPGELKAFAGAISHTLIPVLTNVLTITTLIATIFLKIASTKAGSAILQLLLTTLLLRAALSPIISIFSKLVIFLGRIFNSATLVEGGLAGLKVAMGPLGIAIAAIASTFLVLSGNIHNVGDALKALAPIIGGLVLLLYSRGGLAGALGALSGVLGKIPGLGRLFSRLPGGVAAAEDAGAVAAIRTAGKSVLKTGAGAEAGALEAGGAGALAGGAASTALMGILKKAAWVGVGISAAQGIISGFQHGSVKAGFQDFLHNISFGIIKSADQLAAESIGRINKLLAKPHQTVRQVRAALDPQAGPTVVRAQGGRGAPSTSTVNITPPTQAQTDFGRLNDDQKTFLRGLLDMRSQLAKFARDKTAPGFFEFFYQSVLDFAKHAPPKFKDAVDKLVEDAKHQKKRLDDIWKPEEIATQIQTGFGLALQVRGANITKVVDGIIAQIKPLPAKTKKLAVQSAIDMAQGLEDRGKLPVGSAGKIRDQIVAAYDQMRKRAGKKAAQTAVDTAAAFSAIANVAAVQLGTMVSSVNTILKGLGFGSINIPKNITTKDVNAGASKAGSILGTLTGLLGGSAAGGYVGSEGERGGDFVPKWLGRGEAVLNWAHQRLVEPAMRAMYGFGLSGMFKRTNAKHGWEAPGGSAGGGFVAEPGTNFTVGDEPRIVAALRSLARIMHTTIYGISGYRTPQHSVEVGGFANDPHTRGQAADVGIGSATLASASALTTALLRRVGLYRPFFPADPHEINHVQLIGGAVSKIVTAAGRIATALGMGEHLAAPSVPGSGPLSAVLKGLFGKAYGAANKGIDLFGATGGGGTIPSFKGAWTTVMAKIAQAKHWSLAAWRQLVQGESGGIVSNVNKSSGAFGLGQFLGATGRAYAKFGALSHSGVDQIRAMAQYISDRYHDPTNALRQWLSRSPHWYESGGPVKGRGPVGAVLHGGEHVWTASEVARAGGHAAMRMLRRMVGGGTQALGRRYDAGGAVAYAEPVIHGTNIGGELAQIVTAQRIIAGLSSSIFNKKFTDSLSKSIRAVVGDGGLLDQMNDAVTRLTDRLASSLTRATFKLDRAGNVVKRLDAVGVADRTVTNLQAVYGGLVDEQKAIEKSLADIVRRLHHRGLSSEERAYLTGIDRKLTGRLHDIQTAIADNLSSTFQAVEDQIQAQVDQASKRASLATGRIDLKQRLSSLLGPLASALGLPNNAQLGQQRAGILNMQASLLTEAEGVARSQGHTDLANQIAAQIDDLHVQALEAVQAGLQADADVIQSKAQRRSSQLDLQDRMAAIVESAGGSVLASQMRGATLQQRGTNIQDQIGSTTALLQQAQASGLGALAQTLQDNLDELNTQLAENTQAIKDNVTATRQAIVDQINNRASFQGGVFQGLQGILETISQISGTQNLPGTQSLLQQQQGVLGTAQKGLMQQLLSGFGVNLQGLNGQDLINAISSLNFDSIESNMSDADKQQFEALINQIIQNESALEQNTLQIKTLAGQIGAAQSFSSTSWQWFRQAIFNGAGALLPRYQAPSAMVTSYAPAASTIMGFMQTGIGSGGGTDTQSPQQVNHISIDASGSEVLDPTYVANRIAFAVKTPST